jgi:cell division protein FtsL
MAPDRFEFTYRPDNQWLHRKLDRGRYAQLLLYLAIGIFALVAAIAATWPYLEGIRLGYRVEELRLERDQLQKDIERYRLELSELTDPRSVERAARETHGLEPAGERVILEATPAAAGILVDSGDADTR